MPHTFEPVTRHASRLRRILGALLVGLLLLHQSAADNTPVRPAADPFAPASMDLCTATDDSFLTGELYGALRESIAWRGADLECGGMLRPDNNGIRLVFATPRQDERLLIVFGIEGKFNEMTGKEHATNITIIDELNNRFFSTGRRDRCWSMIESVAEYDNRIVQIVGEVYCTGSVASLSDNSSVTLSDMRFSGRLLLDEPDAN